MAKQMTDTQGHEQGQAIGQAIAQALVAGIAPETLGKVLHMMGASVGENPQAFMEAYLPVQEVDDEETKQAKATLAALENKELVLESYRKGAGKPKYEREVTGVVEFPRWHQCKRTSKAWVVELPSGRVQAVKNSQVTSTGKLRAKLEVNEYARLTKDAKKAQNRARRHAAGECTCTKAWDCPAVRDDGLTNPHKASA